MTFPEYLTSNDIRFLDLCFDEFVAGGYKLTCTELRQRCYARWEDKRATPNK